MRTTLGRYVTAALATLVLTMTVMGSANSFTDDFDELMQEHIKEERRKFEAELLANCESAWYSSRASGTCHFNEGGGISVDVIYCVVEARCRHSFYAGGEYITGYIGSDWRGSVEDTRRLKNCNGNLRLHGC